MGEKASFFQTELAFLVFANHIMILVGGRASYQVLVFFLKITFLMLGRLGQGVSLLNIFVIFLRG